jgi:hypothetical protein
MRQYQCRLKPTLHLLNFILPILMELLISTNYLAALVAYDESGHVYTDRAHHHSHSGLSAASITKCFSYFPQHSLVQHHYGKINNNLTTL